MMKKTCKSFVVKSVVTSIAMSVSLSSLNAFAEDANVAKSLPAKKVSGVSYNEGMAPSEPAVAAPTAPISAAVPSTPANPGKFYAASELLDTYRAQLDEAYKKEEAERVANVEKSRFEMRKKWLQDEVARMKNMIERLRVDTAQSKQDVELYKISLNSLEKDLKETNVALEKATAAFDLAHAEFEKTRQLLEATRKDLEHQRVALSEVTYKKQAYVAQQGIDIEGLRSDITQLRNKIDKLKDSEANYDVEIAKNKEMLSDLKKFIGEKKTEIQAMNEKQKENNRILAETKESVRKSKLELEGVEKEKHNLELQVADETYKLDRQIAELNKQKTEAEKQKENLQASADRLKKYLTMVRQTRLDVTDEQEQARVLALQSKVALASVKSQLQIEAMPTGEYEPVTASAKNHIAEEKREVASVQDPVEPSAVSGKSFVLSKQCKIYSSPSVHGKSSRKAEAGEKFSAEPYKETWMKTHTSSGDFYFKRDCGSME